jgi:hypothetical protein
MAPLKKNLSTLKQVPCLNIENIEAINLIKEDSERNK